MPVISCFDKKTIETAAQAIDWHTNDSAVDVRIFSDVIYQETGNYLRITTRDAVREPVISFLVEMNWSGGHFLREYSLLIDPQN